MAIVRLRDIHRAKRYAKYDINGIDNNWKRLVNLGNLTPNFETLGPYEGVEGAWKDEPCYIIGAGKEVELIDLNKLDKCHTIGINHMIEYYDKFEWFFFLDNRFLTKTTYDINKFKGKIFQKNTTDILSKHLDCVRFKVKHSNDVPALKIEDGLYNGQMSGIAALNLALISGANPIYLIGCDVPYDAKGEGYHIKNYNGEIKNDVKMGKYIGALGFYEKFLPWKDRIINVTENGRNQFFTNIKSKDIPIIPVESRNNKIEIVDRDPVICQVSGMKTIEEMGDISRYIFDKTKGKHLYCNIDENLPKADLYIVESFLNQAEKYINFKKPNNKCKIVSIVHTSGRCGPSVDSDAVVTITNAWKQIIRGRGYESTMIYPGIEIDKYNLTPDYNNKVFGRITRYSPGKVHPNTVQITNNILKSIPDSKCIMFMNNNGIFSPSDRLIIDKSIKINEIEKKVKKLNQLSMFVDMHNTFQETFSLGLLEGMASGLPILLYSKADQPAMREVIGTAGLYFTDLQVMEKEIMKRLSDTEWKKEYGKKAKKRAAEFSIKKMIESYDILFKEVLNE